MRTERKVHWLRSRKIAAFVAALALFLHISPYAVNAWFLNWANVEIAQAIAFPEDSPSRQARLESAERLLDGISFAANGDARIALARARISMARGELQNAAADLRASLAGTVRYDPILEFVWGEAEWNSTGPDAALVHWRGGDAIEFFVQSAHRDLDAHRWVDATQEAEIAVGLDPARADAHHVLGEALSRNGNRDSRALVELERAAELTADPEVLSAIYSRRGEILAGLGDLTGARQEFERALAATPADPRPRTGLAIVQLKNGPASRTAAVASLEQVTRDSPWYTAAFIELAGASEAEGDWMAAEAALKRGLAGNRDDPRLLFALGQLYGRELRFSEAEEMLVLALRNETHADLLLTTAHALAELRNR